MKLTTAIAFFAIAFAGVEATKPAMHGGRLTLQDLLALRNGNMLPSDQMVMVNSNSANEDASVSSSAAAPRATDDLTVDDSEEGLDALPGLSMCILSDVPGVVVPCNKHACMAAGARCLPGASGRCMSRLPQPACRGCWCTRGRAD